MIILVMRKVGMVTSQLNVVAKYLIDGTPYTMKVVRTVWTRGKDSDNFKILPIAISTRV